MPNNNGKSEKNGAEILNEWDKISIWCLNHDNPIKMEITQNTENFKTPFYACENRAKENLSHKICANRLNLDDYQGIVLKLFDLIAANPFCDYTNKTFDYKGARQKIHVKILVFTDDKIHLGILNRTVLG